MSISDPKAAEKDGLCEIVRSCSVCRIAMAKDNVPYVVPMSFGFTYESRILTLYFHCAKEGKKIDFLKQNPVVCFEMDSSAKIIEAREACGYGFSYQSVIGTGKAEFVSNEDEKINALKHIMFHYTGKTDFEFSKAAVDKTLVFKVISEDYTVKRK